MVADRLPLRIAALIVNCKPTISIGVARVKVSPFGPLCNSRLALWLSMFVGALSPDFTVPVATKGE
jgi:hypothetical protein